MRAKPLTNAEKAATNTPLGLDGYVIPYFGIHGSPQPFYRVKLFDFDPKYKQPTNTPNQIYFPPRLPDVLSVARYIILTEGEKKAAVAVKYGFPCAAVGGVENWRNRTFVLPKDTKLAATKAGKVSARVASGEGVAEGFDTVATGLADIVDLAVSRRIPILLCFDSDTPNGPKSEVMRAMATLGYELRNRGVPSNLIRALTLPTLPENPYEKMGLDDFLISEHDMCGPAMLGELIKKNLAKRTAFPRHPNPKDFVNKKLQKPHMSRQEIQALSFAVLADLDARGSRLRSVHDGNLYYFSYDKRTLVSVNFDMRTNFSESAFGIQLYKQYNISAADFKVMSWLGAQFAGEDPVSTVSPEKVCAIRGDVFYYQLNDGQSVKVCLSNGQPQINVINNGEDEVLFEAGLTVGIDAKAFGGQIMAQQKAGEPIANWWYEVLKTARFPDSEEDKIRKLHSLLYYISPWFYRWRGTQLPVEIATGEPGSGKSSLYQLRLDILTGVPNLRNAPSDMRDWASGLAHTGALHVTDNVQLADASLRQKLSDEICRLVTEPNPSIEQRKLYSNADLVRIPVRAVFAITAVKQPFTNVDIIQRAIVVDFDKGVDAALTYDGDWEQHQLHKFGGRAGWLANHLLFVSRMQQLIAEKWDPRYKARYRLINVEQLLVLAAEVVGWDGQWIPEFLEGQRDQRLSDSDWALEGIRTWIDQQKQFYSADWPTRRFYASDIVEWAQGEDEYKQCNMLTNARSLGRYMATNKHTIATVLGMAPSGIYGNRTAYRLSRVQSRGRTAHDTAAETAANEVAKG